MTRITLAAALATTILATPASAQANEEAVATVIRLMVAEGVLSPEKAEAMRTRYAGERASRQPPSVVAETPRAMPAASKAVSLPLPTAGGARLAQELPFDPSLGRSAPAASRASDAAAARVRPAQGSLIDRITLDGDFRIRWQGEFFNKGNSRTIPDFASIVANGGTNAPINTYANTDQDRGRIRIRTRVGITAAVTPRVSVFFRMAVGNDTEPNATNETLGDYFNRDQLVADRAYIRYQVNKSLAFQGGRMANPFFSTDMTWDQDLNPEGVALVGEKQIGEGIRLFGTVGAFALQDFLRSPDRWLHAGQIGLEAPLGPVLSAKVAGTYYHYVNVKGRSGDEASRPGLIVKGNSLFDVQPAQGRIVPGLASPFHIGEVTAAATYSGLAPIVISLTGEVARNFAFDRGSVDRLPLLTGTPTGGMAYSTEFRIGSARVARHGDWQAVVTWRRMESDSLIDAFTEGDFGLGGTNSQGAYFDLLYGIGANTWIEGLFYNTKSLGQQKLDVRMFRAALLTRF